MVYTMTAQKYSWHESHDAIKKYVDLLPNITLITYSDDEIVFNVSDKQYMELSWLVPFLLNFGFVNEGTLYLKFPKIDSTKKIFHFKSHSKNKKKRIGGTIIFNLKTQ